MIIQTEEIGLYCEKCNEVVILTLENAHIWHGDENHAKIWCSKHHEDGCIYYGYSSKCQSLRRQALRIAKEPPIRI